MYNKTNKQKQTEPAHYLVTVCWVCEQVVWGMAGPLSAVAARPTLLHHVEDGPVAARGDPAHLTAAP